MQQNLQAQIQEILSDYGEDVDEIVNEVIPAVAKEAVKKLKKVSPSRRGGGKYAKGWTQETEKGRLTISSTIYNKTPGLPHLLEKSHALRGGGRSTPIVHIEPVEQWANREVVERIEEALEK